MLQEIKVIQNVGRFEFAKSLPHARWGRCTLIFGENGWGKSTLADVLRSLATANPAILVGRKTLAAGPDQKAVLQLDTNNAVFDGRAWSGPTPRIAVYDSVFVNENVFSGDAVTSDHLKNQYGLVVGEEGVRRVRRIVELDDENREVNAALRSAESELAAVVRSVGPAGFAPEDFLKLLARPDIDPAITDKEAEVQRVRRAKEIKGAAVPQLFPLPTETAALRDLLASHIDEIAADALTAVRAHIAAHKAGGAAVQTAHESWLEAGVPLVTTDNCPFCGQPLTDRTLVDAYKDFFSAAYRSLAENIAKARQTFARYQSGDFRTNVTQRSEQNVTAFTYWQEAGQIAPPSLGDIPAVVTAMEQAAAKLDSTFAGKQGNLTEAHGGDAVEDALAAWDTARRAVAEINDRLQAYVAQVEALKASIDPGDLPRLESELKVLHATKRRHEPDVTGLAGRLQSLDDRKKAIADEKKAVRAQLADHGRSITTALGQTINEYLRRLNAGFRIDYQEPNYKSKEPAAAYHILINEVPVPPRRTSDDIDKPSFKNTLSAGDRSTLALALFLAKISADPALGDTTVVLDDPFTSLDDFRREFTANEIRKLCANAAQTVVLSHDKYFLRLLWDKIDHGIISTIALQTGAPGISTIAPYNIEAETQPRHVTERAQLQQFLEGEPHNPAHVRSRLRTVCEHFYRSGDSSLFAPNASLEQIIRDLETAPEDHPYKGALEQLLEINEYSRGDHHAEVPGNPSSATDTEQLKGFCRNVLALTHGI